MEHTSSFLRGICRTSYMTVLQNYGPFPIRKVSHPDAFPLIICFPSRIVLKHLNISHKKIEEQIIELTISGLYVVHVNMTLQTFFFFWSLLWSLIIFKRLMHTGFIN